MKKIKKLTTKQLKQLQKIELEILVEFDRICKKHKLKYVLAGGSCIGAIRHQGFIPWDDDIDVHMHRTDYEKFLKIYKKELDQKKYYFQSMETDSSCGLIYGKIRRKDSIYAESISGEEYSKQGIWIDIFPCDNIPDHNISMRLTFVKVILLKIMYSNKLGYISVSESKFRNTLLKLIKLCSRLISTEKCKKMLIHHMTKYNKHSTKRIICYGGRYLLKEVLDSNHIKQRVLHQFEDYQFYIPKDYHEYLTFLYGDYMQLPPKEKRCSEHLISEIKFPSKT